MPPHWIGLSLTKEAPPAHWPLVSVGLWSVEDRLMLALMLPALAYAGFVVSALVLMSLVEAERSRLKRRASSGAPPRPEGEWPERG